MLAAERFNDSQPLNLGSSYEISIKELMNTIARLTGFEGEIIWDLSQPNGQPRRKLDVTKAAQLFGFRSRVPFEEGLRRTITWYQTTQEQDADKLERWNVDTLEPANLATC